MQIGAQFFTVRNQCQTLEDFALTLRKVADIGYKTVQISGTCPYDAEWLKAQLAANDLKCVLTHIPVPRLVGETSQVIAEHHTFGCEHIGLGWFPFNEAKEDESYAHFLHTFMPVAQQIHEGGRYFMYHNHDQEFKKINGKTILRQMAQDFAPEEMGFTLDTYWIQKGGADPAQYVQEFAGRIPCIHLKDYAFGGDMAVVGEGNINFDRVLAAAEKSGTEYLLVEQDHCYGEDPFDCLQRSYQNLRAMGLK
jgi:sugar phosphate isomerase/epimerase